MPRTVFPDEMEWKETPRGYYLSDVKEKVLFQNPETGMKIALVKAPVGQMDKLHSHPEANQYALMLTGDRKWSLNITPKGEVHGGASLEEEAIALFIWDGSPAPVVAE
jgi:quercetin dioxygenase-like cupin family protein